MSVPAARDGQRMLPVIRVDLDAPVIGYGVKGVVKAMTRRAKSVINGWSVEQQTAMDRVCDSVKHVLDHYDEYSGAGTLAMALNDVMGKLMSFIVLFPDNNPVVLEIFETVHTPHVHFSNELLYGIQELLQSVLKLVSGYKSAKDNPVFLATLRRHYNGIALAVRQGVKGATVDGVYTQAMVPVPSYYPVVMLPQWELARNFIYYGGY